MTLIGYPKAGIAWVAPGTGYTVHRFELYHDGKSTLFNWGVRAIVSTRNFPDHAFPIELSKHADNIERAIERAHELLDEFEMSADVRANSPLPASTITTEHLTRHMKTEAELLKQWQAEVADLQLRIRNRPSTVRETEHRRYSWLRQVVEAASHRASAAPTWDLETLVTQSRADLAAEKRFLLDKLPLVSGYTQSTEKDLDPDMKAMDYRRLYAVAEALKLHENGTAKREARRMRVAQVQLEGWEAL